MSRPDEVSRPPVLWFSGRARSSGTVSPVCDRRNATIAICGTGVADRGSGVERLQSWRVRPRARAEQCHALGRREAVGDQGRASASRPSHRAWLCDAGLLESKRAKRVVQPNKLWPLQATHAREAGRITGTLASLEGDYKRGLWSRACVGQAPLPSDWYHWGSGASPALAPCVPVACACGATLRQ